MGIVFFKPWNTRIRHEKQAEFPISSQGKNTARWTVSLRKDLFFEGIGWVVLRSDEGTYQRSPECHCFWFSWVPFAKQQLRPKWCLCGEFFRTSDTPKVTPPNDLTHHFFGWNMLLFWVINRRKHIIQVNTVASWIYLFHRFVLAKVQQCFSFSKCAFQHW